MALKWMNCLNEKKLWQKWNLILINYNFDFKSHRINEIWLCQFNADGFTEIRDKDIFCREILRTKTQRQSNKLKKNAVF